MTPLSQSDFEPIPFPAEKAYRLLHTHARNGYEPGDCHCEACTIIVDDLCDVLGIKPVSAAALRMEARRRGWHR